jgi:hypothetical protein
MKRLLPIVVLALLLGCGSEPNNPVFGTYRLVGVEGSPLPFLVSSDAECDLMISSGELTLVEGGTYTMEFSGPHDCTKSGGQVATIGRFYTGTFTQTGNAVTFQAEIQGAGTLQFSGTANPLEAFVTVPPIPPATGPDLQLQFAVLP